MEKPVLNYFLEGEAPQGTAGRMEDKARKEISAFKFSEVLTSPKPAKAWQVAVYRLLAAPYLVPEFHREDGLNYHLARLALERLEHLERFTLRPLEFEAGQGEGYTAFDKAQQVASAKAFLKKVRQALKKQKFTPLCLGDFDGQGQPRYKPGTAGERTFEADVKGRPWPDEGPRTAQKPAPQEPNTKALALHLYFLHRAGYLPALDEGKKKATLEAWAKREGVSFQNLYLNFTELSKRHPGRKNPMKLPILEQVLPTLKEFPEALKLAEAELEELKRKK